MLNIEEARKELSSKSYLEIEEATAWKWASRAVVMYDLSIKATAMSDAFNRFLRADTYLSEAKEHAAQVGSGLLERIETAVGPYQFEAIEALYSEGE